MNGKPHAPRRIGGIDIAEIPGGHRKGYRPFRRAKRGGGNKIINNLRHDPRPVDRIDRRQVKILAQLFIGKHRFDDILAVIERAFERDVMHVRRIDACHLPTLHFRGAALRMQDEDIDIFTRLAGLNRGAAGIAGRRADNRDALTLLFQHIIEQPP